MLFATEITAVDPLKPEEGTKTWRGPSIEAESIESARAHATESYGYLQVTGVDGNARVVHREPLLDYTESEPVIEQVSLEVGDVVCLRSGGPAMTIAGFDDDFCQVDYYLGHELVRPTFPTAALMLMHR